MSQNFVQEGEILDIKRDMREAIAKVNGPEHVDLRFRYNKNKKIG